MTAVRQLMVCRLAAIMLLAPAAWAADEADRYTGWLLRDVIEDVRVRAGIDVVYSTDFVGKDTRVTGALRASQPLEQLDEVLAAHGLMLQFNSGTWYVVRKKPAREPASGALHLELRDAASQQPLSSALVSLGGGMQQWTDLGNGEYRLAEVTPGKYRLTVSLPEYRDTRRAVRVSAGESTTLRLAMWPSGPLPMETIVVSTSRYRLLRDPGATITTFDADALQVQPNIGDDPLRVMRRLPGAASGGLSAETHLRGGERDETLLVLNGLELVDPFHLRDYQSLFSAIDRRILSHVDVYTGGFPASYGDALSGVISMSSFEPEDLSHELSVSFFNSSALSSGTFADRKGEWVASARRGNLDMVIDEVDDTLGNPKYRDAFFHTSYAIADSARLMLNAFNAADDVIVVAEPGPDEREEATSDSQNTHVWAGIENRWTDNLYSLSIVSHTRVDSTRSGFANDPEAVVGRVDDQRELRSLAVKQDWTWRSGKQKQSRWGWQWARMKADYNYQSSAAFFGLQAALAGNPAPFQRAGKLALSGEQFSAYVSHRTLLAPDWLTEIGLRWDHQTHTPGGSQWSPRINLLYRLSPATDLRLSAGRFHQSQQIQDLQVEDGVDRFFPAERADQLIVGVDHRLDQGLSLRIEAYQKSMDRLQPRFENVFDPLVILPELAPDRVRIAPDSATLRGLEVSAAFDNGGSFSWSASYAVSRAVDSIDGASVPRSWDQRHAFNAGLSWTSERWEASVAAAYRSGWPTTEAVAIDLSDPDAPEVAMGPRNGSRLGDFATVDVHVARHFPIGRTRLTLFADVINLFNQNNPCCVDYDFAENPDGSERLQQELDYWLPLTPSLGIRWQF